MQDNIESMDKMWDKEQCEIHDEPGCDFEGVQQSLRLNKELSRIMKVSQRNWLLDPILLRDEAKGFRDYLREELFYLKIDLQQHAKDAVRTMMHKFKKALKL